MSPRQTRTEAPTARGRIDARIVIGAVLVLASVAGAWLVLSTGQRATPVYVTTADVATGTRLDPAALEIARLDLGERAGAYLSPGAAIDAAERVAVRPIGAGEVIPLSALGSTVDEGTLVVVPAAGGVPASVGPGSLVDLWSSAPKSAGGAHEPPAVVAAGAEVVRVDAPTGAFAATGETRVEVRVPRAALAAVLDAVARGAQLTPVPAAVAGAR